MPWKRIGKYLFGFYSHEPNEPPHVHIRHGRREAKFWLEPVELARPGHFRSHEIRDLHKIVEESSEELLVMWHEHFGK